MTRISIIGGGQIGEALIAGMIDGGVASSSLAVVEHDDERAQELVKRYNIRATNLQDGAEAADVLIIAIKPQDVHKVLSDIGDISADSDKEQLLVSVAAGVPTSCFEAALPAGSPVVRVMPNTPMLVGKGVCAVAPGRYAHEEHIATVRDLLDTVGLVVEVPEDKIDTVTAVSGSGPAYFFLLVEAMIDAAVELGLSRPLAKDLAIGTLTGAGSMLETSEKSPAQLREGVTSPGGTTAAGVRVFEQAAFRGTISDVMHAVAERSAEMGSAAKESMGSVY